MWLSRYRAGSKCWSDALPGIIDRALRATQETPSTMTNTAQRWDTLCYFLNSFLPVEEAQRLRAPQHS